MKKVLLLIMLVIGFIGNFSCKTRDAEGECSECSPLPPDQIVTIRIGHTDKTFKVWKDGDEDALNQSYVVASEDHPSGGAEISDVLAFYNIDVEGLLRDRDLVAIVLYATAATDAGSLERNAVLGALIYTSTPDQLFMHVFKRTGDEMKLVPELSSETFAVTFNDIYSLSSVFGVQPNIVAWQLMDGRFPTLKKGAKSNFEHKLNRYLKIGYFNTNNNASILETGQSLDKAAACRHPCRRGKGTCVNPDDGSPPYCYGGDEPMCAVVNMQPYNNYDWDSDPRHPILYEFRDNVLGAGSAGTHIKDDFYYCGRILSGKITATQARNGFSLLDNHIVPIVKRLNSAEASADSSVIFDKNVRDVINRFVADIKTLSADPTFLEILDEVTANVNYCEGKTIARIKYELTH